MNCSMLPNGLRWIITGGAADCLPGVRCRIVGRTRRVDRRAATAARCSDDESPGSVERGLAALSYGRPFHQARPISSPSPAARYRRRARALGSSGRFGEPQPGLSGRAEDEQVSSIVGEISPANSSLWRRTGGRRPGNLEPCQPSTRPDCRVSMTSELGQQPKVAVAAGWAAHLIW